MSDVVWFRPRRQWPRSRPMKASCRIHRVPPLLSRSRAGCPIQNSRNGDRSVGPNLIGFRSHLFEHVEIVLMSGVTHFFEDADIPMRNVRHAQAEQRFETIGTHQPCTPRVSCTPVMSHEDSAGDLSASSSSTRSPVVCSGVYEVASAGAELRP